MSISRWMDKEAVVDIHNGLLLSHKKEWILVSSNEVDEPRAYYTEWSKSERERKIAYIWNLERWHWCIYLQCSSGETDIENRLMDTGQGERYGESNMETYIIICKIANGTLRYVSGNSNRDSINPEGWDGEGDGREVQEGGDIMYTYGWFRLIFDRKQQNAVKQVSFN